MLQGIRQRAIQRRDSIFLGISENRPVKLNVVPARTGHEIVPKNNFIPQKFRPWIEARERYRLSHAQIQMARELGMNPAKLGGKSNHDQESWKMPLPEYIESLYQTRFNWALPDDVCSIEDKAAQKRAMKKTKNQAKLVQT